MKTTFTSKPGNSTSVRSFVGQLTAHFVRTEHFQIKEKL